MIKKYQSTLIDVVVFDYQNKILNHANVTLTPKNRKEKVVDLKFVKELNVYRTKNVPIGNYFIKVTSEKFESDKREVSIGPSKFKTTFVLGKKGMPSYYRGVIKIPFEPKNDFIGVSVKPNISSVEEKEFLDQMKSLNLLPEKISEQILKDNIRIFCFPPNINEKTKNNIKNILSRHRVVRLAGPLIQLEKEKASFMTNQLIVKFKPDITRIKIDSIFKKLQIRIIRHIRYAGNTFLVQTRYPPSYDLLKVCTELVKMGIVEYAEPNLVMSAVDLQINPTDFLYFQQWHIPLTDLPNAWETLQNANPPGLAPNDPGDITFGSEDIVIAIMDRGVESQTVAAVTTAVHPDFNGTVTSGNDKVYQFFDFANMVPNNDAPPNDHGMGCAGVATSLANNASVVVGEQEGVSGAAPNCRVMGLIRPSGGTQQQYADAYIWAAGFDPGWVADGINYPVGTVFPATINPGMDIVSNSFILPTGGLMEDTFDYLTTYGRNGKGIPIFCAAGNSNIDVTANNPMAAYEKCITIAASTTNDVKATYSAFGNDIDVCAPSNGDGSGITTCDLLGGGNTAGHTGGGFDYRDNFGGTSSATPLAAGIAALLLSINPDLTWVDIRQIIRNTAVQIDAANTDPVGQWVDLDGDGVNEFSQWYGYGRINAADAVQTALDLVGIDPLTSIDTWIKENSTDIGDVPSLPPFSPDVWVRNADPLIDNPADTNNHQKPIRGQDNWVYTTVRNRGDLDSNDVYVRIYITRWAGTQYVYPDDFIPTVLPSTNPTTPLAPGTYLIGEIHVDSIPANGEITVNTIWPQDLIPSESVTIDGVEYSWTDSCLLVEVSPHDGPPPTGNNTWDNNNLCQRNISIIDPEDTNDLALAFVVGNTKNDEKMIQLRIVRKTLPPNVKLLIDYVDNNTIKRAMKFFKKKYAIEHNKKGKPLFGIPLRRETKVLFPREANKCQVAALHLTGLKKLKKGKYQIDVYQHDMNGHIEGNVTFFITKNRNFS